MMTTPTWTPRSETSFTSPTMRSIIAVDAEIDCPSTLPDGREDAVIGRAGGFLRRRPAVIRRRLWHGGHFGAESLLLLDAFAHDQELGRELRLRGEHLLHRELVVLTGGCPSSVMSARLDSASTIPHDFRKLAGFHARLEILRSAATLRRLVRDMNLRQTRCASCRWRSSSPRVDDHRDRRPGAYCTSLRTSDALEAAHGDVLADLLPASACDSTVSLRYWRAPPHRPASPPRRFRTACVNAVSRVLRDESVSAFTSTSAHFASGER